MTKISVILPYYNDEANVLRAVSSVLNQSYPIDEIILINDGGVELSHEVQSEGNTKIICLSLTNNQGPANARNTGVLKSTGGWIAFLDADETWAIDKIQAQVAFFETHPDFDMCGTLAGVSEETYTSVDCEKWREVKAQDLLWRNVFRTSSVVMRRDAFPGFPSGEYFSEDYSCWLNALFSGSRGALLSTTLTFYDRLPGTAGGLSHYRWKMLLGEFRNFSLLERSGYISMFTALRAKSFSIIKFLFRIIRS